MLIQTMDKHFNINHRVYPEGINQCDLDRIQNGDNSGLLHRIGNSCCWPNNSGNRITVDKVDYQSNDFLEKVQIMPMIIAVKIQMLTMTSHLITIILKVIR